MAIGLEGGGDRVTVGANCVVDDAGRLGGARARLVGDAQRLMDGAPRLTAGAGRLADDASRLLCGARRLNALRPGWPPVRRERSTVSRAWTPVHRD
ncbi:MAG: hypothetical protein JNL44_03000 [Gemmatimonadetes bacterium]|nr:hypothetical protein [Gemmatimonadota bacterium]